MNQNKKVGFRRPGELLKSVPLVDTTSHGYLSRRLKIRCSATGTLPGRALGVNPGVRSARDTGASA